jgi:hypothetical protein
MKDSLVTQLLDVLKREDVKKEFKTLLKPVIDFIVHEITSYIYLIVILVLLIFIMILAILSILIMILCNKNMLEKLFL